MKRFIYVITITFLFLNCNYKQTVEKAIVEKVINDCAKKECIISLKEFTRFEWDKCYVFNYAQSDEVTDKALGRHYPFYDFKVDSRPWIFMKNDSIVYYENNPYDNERPFNNEVHFDFPDSIICKVYTSSDTLFKVKIDRVNDNLQIIILQPVQSPGIFFQ